ncbi:MAG: gliding motility-associated C-terminal domain-containing protein [Flavobacteriales bacterium]|nr:gliding motility-associated C-terminal domain-containing protein [Flavobacteriales bacterium]
MKALLVTIVFLSISWTIFAQLPGQPDRCHAALHHEQLMQDPEYAEAHQVRMSNLKLWIKTHKDETKMDCDEILYIPVAVHFQNPAGGGTIGVTPACAEEMALSQIASLNADFAGTNADIVNWINGQATWPGISNAESCIQFCLATLNHPPGYGLVDGDFAITIDAIPDDSDNEADWAGYMNMYVRDMTNPLGFAPGGGTGNGDGVVCGLPYFGSSNCNGNLSGQYNLGRTVTHEVGHYLSLNHPFPDPPEPADCASLADDGNVTDTPKTSEPTFGCPAVGESNINCTEPVLFPTYMEYCDDACLYMFTESQVETMDAYVNANLQNLLNTSTTVCQEAACIDKSLFVSTSQESCINGNDGSIELTYVGGVDPIQYSFDNGASFQPGNELAGQLAGQYEVLARDAAGCELTATANLQRESPGLNVASSTSAFCGNSDGTLLASTSLNDIFEYNIGTGWQDTTFFDGLMADLYTLSVRNDAGCTEDIQVIIGNETDLNLSINRFNPINCPLYDNGLIEALVMNAEPPAEFRLNNGFPQETGLFEDLSPGDYTMTVEDQRGCKDSFEFTMGISYANVATDCPCEIFIPNAMTPDNNDDLNNVFFPVPSCPITDYTLTIYDRLGGLIFETENLQEPWNGGEGGYFSQSQVYFYKMTFRWGEELNESLDLFEKTGFITVIR